MKAFALAALFSTLLASSLVAQTPRPAPVRSSDQQAIRDILLSRRTADAPYVVSDHKFDLEHLTFSYVPLSERWVVLVRPSASPSDQGFWLFDVAQHKHPRLLGTPLDEQGGAWKDILLPGIGSGYHDFILRRRNSDEEFAFHFDGERYRAMPSLPVQHLQVASAKPFTQFPSRPVQIAGNTHSAAGLTLVSANVPRQIHLHPAQ